METWTVDTWTVDSGHLDSDPGDELISCVTRGPMLMLVQQRGFLVSRVQSDQQFSAWAACTVVTVAV